MVVEKITDKKTKLGLDLENAYFGLVLSHKTTHTKIFLFLLAFWGTHCCVFLACNSQTWADGSLLKYSSKKRRNQLRAPVLLEITGWVQTCLILDIGFRPLKMNFQEC